jgi:CubicO group peptidase (beta-lactamase class C family)
MLLAALLALLPATALAAAPSEPAPLKELPAYVTRSMEDWKVPGVAIAVVKDGRLVWARGFGVREVGKPERVDSETVFALGSLTKGFTAASVGLLVDEGKLAWDDPVVRHLPSFAVADPYVTRELTLRDLLAHRSGLKPEADFLWYGTTYGRQDILARLRHLEQASGLRTTYSYSNVLYLVAGEVAAARAGMSWDDLVRTRLFEPLGMRSTGTRLEELLKRPNRARPHVDRTGSATPIAHLDGGNVGPAAAIHSNVKDMARWLQLMLGRGTLDGKKVLSAEVVDALHTPQTLIPRGAFARKLFPESHLDAAGMGWVLKDHRGKWMVWNTGGMDGMSCSAALLPEEGLGVVVLTNGPRISFPEALVYRVVDAYLGAPAKDWSRLRLEASLEHRARQKQAELAQEKARIAGTKPTLPLARYAGTYAQRLMGEASVTVERETLRVRLAGWEGEAEHWHHDTFRVTWSNPELGTSLLTFQLDADGAPSRLVLQEVGAFERQG